MINNSLKEYYIKLHSLYNNAVNMLTAINQSLTTNASEVSIPYYNENNEEIIVKLPSFPYLDNKLEQLDTTISNLFEMPNSGEAWFTNEGNMYKLQMVRANSAPLIPILDTTQTFAGVETNTFIKDLVNPRTYLRVNIENLPNNIEQMCMKKIVFLNMGLYDSILEMGINTYEEYVAALYNYKKGVDYDEYDTVLNLPIKQDKYKSSFKIVSIIDDGFYSSTTTKRLTYKIQLDTIEYYNAEDSAEAYNLKIGDYICLGNELAIYRITDVDYTTTAITMEEYIGHIALQRYDENNEMVLTKYNYDYSEYQYINIPVEENQYIAVFLGTLYNGVRSLFSDAMLFDLSSIYMMNENGSYILDNDGNKIDYITYYNQYCNNIGDLILGLTQTAYPQLSNYNAYQLDKLQDGDDVKNLVSLSFNTENTLTVVPINTHIFEDGTIDNIKKYHQQKESIIAELNTLTDNINTTNSTLINTDWSQETDITQESLQSQLKNYYSQRLLLEKQLVAVVDDISVLTNENNVTGSTKYRVRGVTNTLELENYVRSITNSKVNLIGLDVEYKYKSISKNITTLANIDNSTFTDWNRLNNIDRQRKLVFNEATNAYSVEFVNYSTIANIIKWNQIDIPITANEDVVIRIRYKYNIGQPFINLYTPWSEELTVAFPTEYAESVELATIVASNDTDSVSAKFTKKLVNDGYEDHVTNNLIVNNQIFYHMPENIYSGFNTNENNMLSLKDKLNNMCQDIETYRDLVTTESQKKFAVYLQYDNKTTEIFNNTTNKINLYNIDHISDFFIKKEMNIIIKNIGEVPVNFYSIFPGQTDIPLILCNYEYYKDNLHNYHRVPMFAADTLVPQYLGQWIYFREKNVYTGKSNLYNSSEQESIDYANQSSKFLNVSSVDIFSTDNIQLGLANKYYKSNSTATSNYLGFISKNSIQQAAVTSNDNISYNIEDYFYDNYDLNKCIYKYEDIHGIEKTTNTVVYLDSDTSISQFCNSVNLNSELQANINAFDGGFFYVDLENLDEVMTTGGEKDNYELGVGQSVSIPVVFEYFLSNKESITKNIQFDLRNSLIKNPLNYIIEITANYDNSLEATLYSTSNTTSLVDEATDIN